MILIFNYSTRAEAAGALVRLGRLPSKLNPVVKPLMDSIKMQVTQLLQVLLRSALCSTGYFLVYL